MMRARTRRAQEAEDAAIRRARLSTGRAAMLSAQRAQNDATGIRTPTSTDPWAGAR